LAERGRLDIAGSHGGIANVPSFGFRVAKELLVGVGYVCFIADGTCSLVGFLFAKDRLNLLPIEGNFRRVGAASG
jgi:hypothetical protein